MNYVDTFLAIIYARGTHKATKIKTHKLCFRLWGIPIISETMACNRFIKIMRFLRFDYKQTRSHRLATDKLTLLSTIWNTFVKNCLKHYRPSTNITVDEQLFPIKAQCRFTQYMPNKPDKITVCTVEIVTRINMWIVKSSAEKHAWANIGIPEFFSLVGGGL